MEACMDSATVADGHGNFIRRRGIRTKRAGVKRLPKTGMPAELTPASVAPPAPPAKADFGQRRSCMVDILNGRGDPKTRRQP